MSAAFESTRQEKSVERRILELLGDSTSESDLTSHRWLSWMTSVHHETIQRELDLLVQERLVEKFVCHDLLNVRAYYRITSDGAAQIGGAA
ncbi:hypothetical protein [Yoonia vestfoldensis]|uniref:ArsR family transcriptional regulator n=1 Tax=Yoonia vestfoldensis TaxID=245188 RepID=A0A1Y0EHA3_9RHOB|nr:hypothetical protein [Yoonia vestfoldensis]ARU02997.1 hypothetical protein LOKVESSMR4R_03731 [Yoonia vestfoldensis]